MTPILDEIRASHLAEWARTHETAQWMPSLMVQLVGASETKVTACRFLTHEETTSGFAMPSKLHRRLTTRQTFGWMIASGRSFHMAPFQFQ